MSDLEFEWDKRKAASNLRKHGVSFENAKTVFLDDNALLIADPDSSDDDDRFILFGLSSEIHLLVVCHCYRSDDQIIQIISARKANKSEQQQYSQRWRP